VVVILVMNRELSKLFAFELASAPSADPGKHLECLLTIGFFPTLSVTPRLGLEILERIVIRARLFR
jgi:hypothetical protein